MREGNPKRRTALGESCIKWFSDRGSIPLASTKKPRDTHRVSLGFFVSAQRINPSKRLCRFTGICLAHVRPAPPLGKTRVRFRLRGTPTGCPLAFSCRSRINPSKRLCRFTGFCLAHVRPAPPLGKTRVRFRLRGGTPKGCPLAFSCRSRINPSKRLCRFTGFCEQYLRHAPPRRKTWVQGFAASKTRPLFTPKKENPRRENSAGVFRQGLVAKRESVIGKCTIGF